MTGKIGGLSTPIIAMIAVLGIAGLLILTTVLAFLVDLPGRIRRNKAAKQDGRKSIMDEADVEKAEPVVTVTEMNSQSSYSSQDTRAPSPVCQCEHPHPVSPRLAMAPRLPSHTEVD
jgi:hypothetical protein